MIGWLPEDVRRAIVSRSRSLSVPAGATVRAQYEPIDSVYFLERGMLSLLARTGGSRSAEVAKIGAGGAIGLSVTAGSRRATTAALALSDCDLVELERWQFLAFYEDEPSLQEFASSYRRVQLDQVMRESVCHALHTVQQRLANWILTVADGLGGKPITLTHATLSDLLGVRRASITDNVHLLEGKGAVVSCRQSLRIRDRAALQAASCDCKPAGGSRLDPQADRACFLGQDA